MWTLLQLNFKAKICNEAASDIDTQMYSSPLICGDMFQDPQGVPATVASTEPYSTIAFLYMHTYDKV